jgi:Holliday junction resolvase RusA-like endonuclease
MRCEISPKSTSELGVEKFGVSPATIERDAQYKRAVDTITSLGGVQLRTLLLSGEISLKKAELIALGKQVHLCPEAVALKLGIALDFLGNPNSENSPLDSTKGANDSPSQEQPTESDSDLAVAHHLKLSQGGLVEIDAPAKKLLHGRYGRIESVGEKTAQVWVWNAIFRGSKLHSLPHRQLTPVPLEKEPQLKDVCDRISRLYQRGGSEPIEWDILGLLEREVAYSPTQLDYLAGIEAKYLPQSGSNASNAREPIATSPVVEVIELPFLPPTLNEIIDTERSDKYAAAKEKRRWTNEVADACQGKHQFSGQVSIDYHWRVKNTKRGPNNISASTKFIDDGLVAAKVITDDSLEVIVSVSHRYEKAERDRVRITITEIK